MGCCASRSGWKTMNQADSTGSGVIEALHVSRAVPRTRRQADAIRPVRRFMVRAVVGHRQLRPAAAGRGRTSLRLGPGWARRAGYLDRAGPQPTSRPANARLSRHFRSASTHGEQNAPVGRDQDSHSARRGDGSRAHAGSAGCCPNLDGRETSSRALCGCH
jgi:hypothetical protein